MPQDRFLHPRLGHSHKISALNHLEFRVWTQYVLTANDYGVMRCSALTVQSANDALAHCPRPTIERALQALIDVGLVVEFSHQEERYICQLDWQDFQKVKYPRETHEPVPSSSIMERCSQQTQELFAFHSQNIPDIETCHSKNISEKEPVDSKNVSETCEVLARAGGRERLMANGERLMANGKRLTANGKRLEAEIQAERFAQFWAVYPKKVGKDAAWRVWQKRRPSHELTQAILAALEHQHEFLQRDDGRFIPNPATWLNQGRWKDEPPAVSRPPERPFTATEIQEAKRHRQAIGRCPHDPVCATSTACEGELIRRWRRDRGDVA